MGKRKVAGEIRRKEDEMIKMCSKMMSKKAQDSKARQKGKKQAKDKKCELCVQGKGAVPRTTGMRGKQAECGVVRVKACVV